LVLLRLMTPNEHYSPLVRCARPGRDQSPANFATDVRVDSRTDRAWCARQRVRATRREFGAVRNLVPAMGAQKVSDKAGALASTTYSDGATGPDAADECGVVELDGKAVGASFVGVSACIAVAEATREVPSGIGLDLLTLFVAMVSDSAPASQSGDVVSLALSRRGGVGSCR
jgi:hypothetical protein